MPFPKRAKPFHPVLAPLSLAGILAGAVFGASAALADVSVFRMPSGNIECSVGEEVDWADLRCVIFDRSGSPAAPRPSGCDGPWGHVFVLLERGPVRMECGSPGRPTASPGTEVARYGQRGTWGRITCLSSERGLECSNADGRGFFLSRARQTIR